MQKFRILAIDGGGLRGVVPLTILKKVEEMVYLRKIWECFDLIAGTSTGGLITCAITLKNPNDPHTTKYSLDQIMDVYITRGKEIFPQYGMLERGIHALTDLFNPTFSDKGIAKVFRHVLGNYTMNDCLTSILLSTYDLTNNIPLFFKSMESKTDAMLNTELYNICRATSAGPTYLPTYSFHYPKNPNTENPRRNCIDGGVFVNNPSMAALAEFSKNHAYYLPSTAEDKDIDYKSVYVLSVGTGSYSNSITLQQSQKKGELYWAKNISDIMMRGVNKTTDYEMNEVMEPGNYLRLTININNAEHSNMANSSEETTNYLIKATQEQVLANTALMDKLDDFVKKI